MPAREITRQIKGTVANVRDEVFSFSLQGIIPPSMRSTLVWVRDVIPRGLGFADRSSHLAATFPLSVLLLVTTGWWLTVLAVLYSIVSTVAVGIRFIPAVNARWPVDERSWPFWTVREKGMNEV